MNAGMNTRKSGSAIGIAAGQFLGTDSASKLYALSEGNSVKRGDVRAHRSISMLNLPSSVGNWQFRICWIPSLLLAVVRGATRNV